MLLQILCPQMKAMGTSEAPAPGREMESPTTSPVRNCRLGPSCQQIARNTVAVFASVWLGLHRSAHPRAGKLCCWWPLGLGTWVLAQGGYKEVLTRR